jgi:hypothetical protein
MTFIGICRGEFIRGKFVRKKHEEFLNVRNEVLEVRSQPRRDAETLALEKYLMERIVERETSTDVSNDGE